MTSSQETKITAAFSYIKNVGKHILFNFKYDLLGYKRLLDNPADFAWFTDVFHSYCSVQATCKAPKAYASWLTYSTCFCVMV